MRRLTAEHVELHWAVAWGSIIDVAKDLLKHSAKFRNVTFGAAFCQMDPDLIEALVGMSNAQGACRFPKGAYHPQVYLLQVRRRSSSHCREGASRCTVFQDLFAFSRSCRKYGVPLTADFATAYHGGG
ncbi:hypothetical protein M527_15440 [Sphingobium indicum IP26]|uniref:Uncharacterized protein n=1 Tax=Sphingobium indicum F2 TaxID=1450518 RepID=A0A8E0WPZ2_9SPHN|nr:hypothetical protein [Sphingobium indicum]EPR17725.1 hypothetical protein M527_15440 [Sphingobium indicum IP26]KER35264.1 hypothetical protein AL00_16900 [Sphingobium indicum F2]